MTTTFSDAFRATPITHDTLDDLFATTERLRRKGHLLVDQRDTARAMSVSLEEQTHLLRVACASALAMLDRIAAMDFYLDGDLSAVRVSVARALEVTE